MRANRRALRTIHDELDLAVRYVNALIWSLSEEEARRHYERYVAPYLTADGRHDPSAAAQAVPAAVAEELGVSTVPDVADIYRTEPAEAPAAQPIHCLQRTCPKVAHVFRHQHPPTTEALRG